MTTPTGLTKDQWDMVIRNAVVDGVLTTTATTAACAALALVANRYHAGFRNSLSLSGKVATVISPAVFVFWHQTQTTVVAAKAQFGSPAQKNANTPATHLNLPSAQLAANWVYDNPFLFAVTLGSTAVGTVFGGEHLTNPRMKLASRGILVGAVCGTFLFHNYMKTNGPFIEVAGCEEPEQPRKIARVAPQFVPPTLAAPGYSGPLVPGDLHILQEFANWVQDNRSVVFGGLGSAAVGGVFASEYFGNPSLRLLAHLKAIGFPAAVIMLAAFSGSVVFDDYMQRFGGKFVPPLVPADPQQRVVKKEHPAKSRLALYFPLFYAPMLPLMRISLHGRIPRKILDRLFLSAVFIVWCHRASMTFSDSTIVGEKEIPQAAEETPIVFSKPNTASTNINPVRNAVRASPSNLSFV